MLFASKSAAHTSGQRMPGGVLVITSPWLPEVTTESVSLEKSATIVRSSSRVRRQLPVPGHSGVLQPASEAPAVPAGTAVRTTVDPLANVQGHEPGSAFCVHLVLPVVRSGSELTTAPLPRGTTSRWTSESAATAETPARDGTATRPTAARTAIRSAAASFRSDQDRAPVTGNHLL